jgi:uncharacterized protein (DUF2252 family)
MTKYLRLDANETKYLKDKAVELDMVFKSPNAVLRDILGLVSKNTSKPPSGNKQTLKIRVDEDVWRVWKQIEAKAKELNTNTRSLDKLVKEFSKQEYEGPPQRPGVRPPTRRR